MSDRFDIVEGHYIAALDWGHYGMISRLGRYFRPSPLRDTHAALVAGGEDSREAHRVYHLTSRRYTQADRAGRFDPYSPAMPRH